MAGRIGILNFSGVATGTAAKTIAQLIAAANHAIKIIQVNIGGHGTSATAEPIKVRLVRQSDAGTMSAATLRKADDSIADTLDTTGQHTATAEPTEASELAGLGTFHPQLSKPWEPPFGAACVVGAGDRVGLEVTAAADVNVDGSIWFEE